MLVLMTAILSTKAVLCVMCEGIKRAGVAVLIRSVDGLETEPCPHCDGIGEFVPRFMVPVSRRENEDTVIYREATDAEIADKTAVEVLR